MPLTHDEADAVRTYVLHLMDMLGMSYSVEQVGDMLGMICSVE